MRIALYHPDIPQNVGAVLRISACFGVGVDIIGPCGFPFDDARVRRVAMDYIHLADYSYHSSWEAFLSQHDQNRLVLMTTKGSVAYTQWQFGAGDILLFGRESAGVPQDIHAMCDAKIRIPMREGARSLNLAVSAGIVVSEALRQMDAGKKN
ncbi:MAG: tRNA (cytidine(34)-2'-O)-methyltransferase [Alphaproteobacteria bacterium]|nr:tRNA (cytidine(34)-2'-O)-methyltransferase [Alphaproteobacteria bacterium]